MRRLVRAGVLLDGAGSAEYDRAVLIDGPKIVDTGPSGKFASIGGLVERIDFPYGTILPGLIDCHAHLTFGTGDRTYEDVMSEDSDEMMIARGMRNCGLHLSAGVTTVRDCGARNNTALMLRDGARRRQFRSPRLLVSGPPLTPTKGHFWFCNGEADGVTGVRRRAGELIAQNVDLIKVMASGGGTAGTDSAGAAYSAEEISAVVDVARYAGKPVVAHCLSAASVENALEAGVDSLEHINFIQPDGTRRMDDAIARRIVERQVFVSPTIQTGYRRLQKLKALPSLSLAGARQMRDLMYKLETKLGFVERLHKAGARIIAATDAIEEFGDYAIGLELLTLAGLTPLQAIRAATAEAAEALGVARQIGTICAGKEADLLVVRGDPSVDITHLCSPLLVMQAGEIVFRSPA